MGNLSPAWEEPCFRAYHKPSFLSHKPGPRVKGQNSEPPTLREPCHLPGSCCPPETLSQLGVFVGENTGCFAFPPN